MKGKPISTPSNHVQWVNGFKSNMPDWITARECAYADEMLYALKRARILLMLDDRQISNAYSMEEQRSIQECVCNAIDQATGMDTIGRDDQYIEERTVISKASIKERAAMPDFPSIPGFPPIPGVK